PDRPGDARSARQPRRGLPPPPVSGDRDLLVRGRRPRSAPAPGFRADGRRQPRGGGGPHPRLRGGPDAGWSAVSTARRSPVLRTRLDQILVSFWFVPGLMAFAGALLCVAALYAAGVLAQADTGLAFVRDRAPARRP